MKLPNFNPDRKCKREKLLKELEGTKDCESFVSKDHDEYEFYERNCNHFLRGAMVKSLGDWRKNLFKNTLKKIKNNYKLMYPDKKVQEIIDSISDTTNFEYRLPHFVAGARQKGDLSRICMMNDAPWCKSDYVIMPGGKVFLKPENLELVLAHEIGHVINDVQMPKDYDLTVTKIQKCNHLGSKRIKNLKEQLEEETSADIHMAKYAKKFMNPESINDHFCNYRETHNYEKESVYLNSIHRQALINCDY